MFPSAQTGTVEAPMVIDMSELLASHGVIKNKEDEDRATFSVLVSGAREALRPQLFAWAAAGFPNAYVLQQFTISPPSVCSDGVVRGVCDYVPYLLNRNMDQIISGIQALCVGVTITYSLMWNTLRIHVTRQASS